MIGFATRISVGASGRAAQAHGAGRQLNLLICLRDELGLVRRGRRHLGARFVWARRAGVGFANRRARCGPAIACGRRLVFGVTARGAESETDRARQKHSGGRSDWMAHGSTLDTGIEAAIFPTCCAGLWHHTCPVEAAKAFAGVVCASKRHGRKVRAPQGRMLANGQWGRPRGKCHRKQTAALVRKDPRGKGETAR